MLCVRTRQMAAEDGVPPSYQRKSVLLRFASIFRNQLQDRDDRAVSQRAMELQDSDEA